MAEEREVSGRCLCGTISFTARAGGNNVGVCHCSMCQRWAGGPLLALDCEPQSLRLSGSDHLGVYTSSDWGERCFCSSCGSPLFWRSRDGKHLVVSAGALDGKDDLKLSYQIFIDQKPGYYAFANETQDMTGTQFMAMMTAEKQQG